MSKKSNADMNFAERVGYYLLLGCAKLIGYLPYWVLYRVLAPFIYFVLYRLLHYRVKVVRANLSAAFPEKSEEERREIECKFYHQLSENMVDVVDMTSMSAAELKRRMKVTNAEQTDEAIGNRNWIAALAHYGEWEYFSVYAIDHPYHNIGVYHPLSSKVMDRFMLYIRRRFGMEVAPMNGLARPVMKNLKAGEQMALGLIADQRPRFKESDRVWREFLGQPTLFFGGVGNYAKKFGMMVYTLDIRKVKPSHFECEFVQLYDGVEDISELEIMDRYVAHTEYVIRRNPEMWLWSHRRWKNGPDSPDVEIRKVPQIH
ncbi:MAG: lysophospholipid acyltransferase family protein [Tidjanibacter sp.]|nr:lysophospholipid acyltransferase family protein [Tidjanibacter sp.]